MVLFPNCKINLGLSVLARRSDGYHDIDTVFYPVPWCDVLEIIPAQTNSFTNTGIPIPGRQEDNLCLRAYYLLRDKFDLPSVAIHLHKNVPLGAGLGGGSSDGAFTLKLLNELFELDLSASALEELAGELGSDCPYFIQAGVKSGAGRGEILQKIDFSLEGKYLIIAKPDIHIPTPDAFKKVKPAHKGKSNQEILLTYSAKDWKEKLCNDFERGIFDQYPAIENLKKELYNSGAIYASLTGSGSSVYGLFESPIDLSAKMIGCTYWSGAL